MLKFRLKWQSNQAPKFLRGSVLGEMMDSPIVKVALLVFCSCAFYWFPRFSLEYLPSLFIITRRVTDRHVIGACSLVRVDKTAKRWKRNLRNVCRIETDSWGRGALRDSGPSGCEGDSDLDLGHWLRAQFLGCAYVFVLGHRTQVSLNCEHSPWNFFSVSD